MVSTALSWTAIMISSIFCLDVNHQDDVIVCYLYIIIIISMTSLPSAWVSPSMWCHCPLPVDHHRHQYISILCLCVVNLSMTLPFSVLCLHLVHRTNMAMIVIILCCKTQCGSLTWSGWGCHSDWMWRGWGCHSIRGRDATLIVLLKEDISRPDKVKVHCFPKYIVRSIGTAGKIHTKSHILTRMVWFFS